MAHEAAAADPVLSRRTLLGACAGSLLEYYDFFVYASSAALIFAPLFFPDAGAVGLLLSLATFGVAYVVRPLGAVVLGHFGDRIGRKNVVVATLTLMGGATFLIGCLPTFGQAGIAAPVLLVTLRLVQGFSAGGESAGAGSLILEAAPPGRRGFYASVLQGSILGGFVVANLVVVAVGSLPREQLVAWGWRVPFLASAALLVCGLVLRRKLTEPALFAGIRRGNRVLTVPLMQGLRHQWRDLLRLLFATFIQAPFTWMAVLGLSFAVNAAGVPGTTMLWILIGYAVVSFVAYLLGGLVGDRVGRRPTLVGSGLAMIVGLFLFFGAIHTGDVALVTAAAVVSALASYGCGNSPAYFAEMFDARVRYSSTAVGTQVGTMLTGLGPVAGAAILAGHPERWPWAAALAGATVLAAVIAIATGRETFDTPLDQLGRSAAPDLGPAVDDARAPGPVRPAAGAG